MTKKQSGSISTDAANSIWIVLFNDITRIFVWRSRKKFSPCLSCFSEKIFSPCLSCFSARHWPPFSRALCDRTGFCRVSFSVDFPFNSLGAFFCRRFWQYFPPQIKKIYFICSKENTYLYLNDLLLLYLFLLLGEKIFFPPSPVQSRHSYRRLID